MERWACKVAQGAPDVQGEQRVLHLADGANEWTALREPDPYPADKPATRFVCGVTSEFSTFTVGAPKPSSTAPGIVNRSLILRIEPSVRSVTLSAGDRVALAVDVYGRQKILDNSLADDVVFEWEGDGDFNGEGREVVYTAPDSPGTHTVTVSFANDSDCAAHRDGAKCEA